MKKQISIVTINRNGGETLRKSLTSLRIALEEGYQLNTNFEFIIVDNGSTDDSIEITKEKMQGAPFHWQIVHESEAGVNAARNAGLRAASGHYLIFTDNDLDFDSQWLSAYFEAFSNFPECRVFGGRVKVGEIAGKVPSWLDLTGQYSRPSIVVRCENGDRVIQADLKDKKAEGPVGPNMAFERSIFEDHGVFDTNFGLRPGSLVPGAEAEFFHRLAEADEKFVYVPDACVHHPLKQSQMTKGYFRRRMSGVGRVLARIQKLDGIQATRYFGVKRYLFRSLLESWVTYLLTFVQNCPQKRFFDRCNISIVWGQILEDFENRKDSTLKSSAKTSTSNELLK